MKSVHVALGHAGLDDGLAVDFLRAYLKLGPEGDGVSEDANLHVDRSTTATLCQDARSPKVRHERVVAGVVQHHPTHVVERGIDDTYRAPALNGAAAARHGPNVDSVPFVTRDAELGARQGGSTEEEGNEDEERAVHRDLGRSDVHGALAIQRRAHAAAERRRQVPKLVAGFMATV